MTPNWHDFDDDSGEISDEHVRRMEAEHRATQRTAQRDVRRLIADKRAAGTYYELPPWMREQYEDRARERLDD